MTFSEALTEFGNLGVPISEFSDIMKGSEKRIGPLLNFKEVHENRGGLTPTHNNNSDSDI
jgi:hypothetical protein